MAKENPTGGGVVWYGHSTDADADFSAAMSALSASDGTISSVYPSDGFLLKYNWMPSNYNIVHLTNATGQSYTGFAYSVFRSDTNDVFAILQMSDTPFSAPKYDGSGSGNVWNPSAGGSGTTQLASSLTIAKLQTTDVLNAGTTYQYFIFSSSAGGGAWVYPNNADSTLNGSSLATSTLEATISGRSGFKYTTLCPIESPYSSALPTYTRGIWRCDTVPAIGAYQIGGFTFRIVRGLEPYSGQPYFLALRNGSTSS